MRIFHLSISLLLMECLLGSNPANASGLSRNGQIQVPGRFMTIFPEHSSYLAFQAAEQKPKPGDLPDGKGKDVTKRVCSGCHAVAIFSQQRHNQDKWASILDQMVAKGMDASDDDLAIILDYLSTNLGESKQPPTASTPPDSPPSQ